jgi:hypothetical protein
VPDRLCLQIHQGHLLQAAQVQNPFGINCAKAYLHQRCEEDEDIAARVHGAQSPIVNSRRTRRALDLPPVGIGGIAMTASECLQRAAECDGLAATTDSDTARYVMKAAAAQWRKIAETITTREHLALPVSPNSMRAN